MTEQGKLPHCLTLDERKRLTLTGVTEVVSFDEGCVVLKTAPGTLIVQGQGLQLKQLSPDSGSMEVQGQVAALSYEEPRQGGWLSRLLR